MVNGIAITMYIGIHKNADYLIITEELLNELTSRERFTRIFDHKEADRIPFLDSPWRTTIQRWHHEGLPSDADYINYFNLDHVGQIRIDTTPRFEQKILEETDEYKIVTTEWGVTMRRWKHADSTPEFLDQAIVDPDSWEIAKKRISPNRDRINWDMLRVQYPQWRAKDIWIQANLWFGFDVTHSWIVGTERLLCALITEPEWCMDMFSHLLDTQLKVLDMLWEEGYTFHSIRWPDDMGFKNGQFFSVATYRELLKPFHQRAIKWAHDHGVKACLHSCGNITPFIPELVEIGLDAINPLEVKAGMDPLAIKKQWGDALVLHGGINAALWDQPEKIKTEIIRLIPVLKEHGGYIFASDHSIPSDVSFNDFREIVDIIKELGAY